MKNSFFHLLFLTLFLVTGTLSAQYDNSNQIACESEVANLKEQISRIIIDSQKSLEESERKLKAALQRINSLESENERLREGNFTSENTRKNQTRRLLARLQDAEASAARLSDENMALRKQQESISANQEEYEADLASALESAQTTDRVKLRQQKETQRIMESNLDHAYKEMVLLKAELRASNSELETLKKENTEIRRWADVQKKTYERQLETNQQELEVESKTARIGQNRSLECGQMIDSLKFELSSKQRMIEILNHTEQVEKNRISRIETNEKGIQESKFKLEIREQLLFARERDLSQRQKELELKEERYSHLLEKEKELKLLEQRLRQYARPDASTGEVRKFEEKESVEGLRCSKV